MAVKPNTGQSSAAPATAAGVESAATEDDDFHDAVEEATETPTRGDDTGSDHSDWGDAGWEPAGGGDGAGADAEVGLSRRHGSARRQLILFGYALISVSFIPPYPPNTSTSLPFLRRAGAMGMIGSQWMTALPQQRPRRNRQPRQRKPCR